MKEIVFKNGYSTLIDDDDYDRYMTKKWNCNRDVHSGNYYVTTQVKVLRYGKWVYRKFSLAEFIIGTPPVGMEIDHINRISTDNRKENLRFCTHQENLRNRRKHKNCSSPYKGVTKRYDGCYAQIVIDRKCHHLGKFKTEKEAALAYNDYALKHYGEFASINVID